VKYDPGGKTPLKLGQAAAAVHHVGPARGDPNMFRKAPVGDIEDLLRKWEFELMDEDGSGDLTAEAPS